MGKIIGIFATICVFVSVFSQTSVVMTNDKGVNEELIKSIEKDGLILLGISGEYITQKKMTDSIKKAVQQYAIYEAMKEADRHIANMPQISEDKRTRLNQQYDKYIEMLDKLYIHKSVRDEIGTFSSQIRTTQENIIKDINNVKNSSDKSVNKINTIDDLLNEYEYFINGVSEFYMNMDLIVRYGNTNPSAMHKQKNYIDHEKIANDVLFECLHF